MSLLQLLFLINNNTAVLFYCYILCREYAGAKKKRFKPVIISHHMLSGLKEGQEKMSKSDPDSAIFMEDTAEDVKRKIKKAYCPPGIVEKNPIMDYAKHVIFGYYGLLTVSSAEVKKKTIIITSHNIC